MTATYVPTPPAAPPGPPTAPPYGSLAAPASTGALTHYAPQPAAPAPVFVQAPARGRSSNAAMGLVVILLAVLATVAGYVVAKAQAPNPDEIARYQDIAAAEGFRSAQLQGVAEGRNFAIESQRRITQYRAAIARQKAWNKGYRRGMGAGRRQPVRRSYGYSGGGYRAPAPRYRGPSNNQRAISSAIQSAQALANQTGAPVDIEVF